MRRYRIGIVGKARPDSPALEDDLQGIFDMEVAFVSRDSLDTRGLIARQSPDVLLLDLDGSEESAAVIYRLKQHHPKIKIVLVSAPEADTVLLEALKAGAMGYLPQHAEPSEIVRTIRAVAQGGGVLSPPVTALVLEELRRLKERSAEREEVYHKLTRQETEVLRRLARNMTNEQIGHDLFLEMSTVKKHVGNVLKKLHVNNRQDAAHIARQIGF